MDFLALWGICSFIALGSTMSYVHEKHNQDLNKPVFYAFAFIFGPLALGFILQDIASDLKKIKDNTKAPPN